MIGVKTILLVENDPVSQTMYQQRLEREGFCLECANDGVEAVDSLSVRTPDLGLLDLMLPRLSGADVLQFIQADPRLTTVPVIIFSNAPLTEVPPDSPLAAGTRRLVKSECPFPMLLQTIQEALAAAPEMIVVEARAETLESSTTTSASPAANRRRLLPKRHRSNRLTGPHRNATRFCGKRSPKCRNSASTA